MWQQQLFHRILCHNLVPDLDDILVTGRTEEEHLRNLEECLRRLQNHGVRVNKVKCRFMQNRVQFLGVIIDAEGQHASNEKIEAVLKAPCMPSRCETAALFLGHDELLPEAFDSSTAA